MIESYGPAEYIGVDISKGPGVDQICGISNLTSKFGKSRFDIVVCTEVIEHVFDWSNAIANLKQVLCSNGLLLVTTRSRGFPYHGFPFDYWRFEHCDFERIFSDMDIISIEHDSTDPGIFILAVKPQEYITNSHNDLPVYSMLTNNRVIQIDAIDQMLGFLRYFQLIGFFSSILPDRIKALLK